MDERLAQLRAKMVAEQRSPEFLEAQRLRERYSNVLRDDALKANLLLWLDTHQMHDLPEAFQISIIANTGLRGGDAGHGGELAIRFKTDSGCNSISLRPTGRSLVDDGVQGEVTLTARGDWEQEGLISGIASLLLGLLNQDRD